MNDSLNANLMDSSCTDSTGWLAVRSGRMGATTVKDVRFPVSIRNEKAALLKLQQMVGELLGTYPSTLEADMERMQNGSLKPFSNQKHAVIQIVGEKTVLHHYRDFCEVALDLIALDPRDDEAYQRKVHPSFHPP